MMYTYGWQDFWWNSITGPHKAVTGVAESLLAKSLVILKVPADLPWRRPMRSAIEDQIRTMTGAGNTIITQIDAADECDGMTDPGRFLLQRFATSDIVRGYREKSGVTLQNYMIRNAVLRDSIVWVKGLDQSHASKWIKFCRDFRGESVSDGLFVLEIHGNISVADTKNIRVIDFDECVREYDVQLFNSFILDDQNMYSDLWKQYIATLAARLCKNDAEVSELYLRQINFMTDDPLLGIARIAEMPEFARRGEDRKEAHVLSLWRDNNLLELANRVWEAQLQVLFPIIELHRVAIINQLHSTLLTCLNEHHIFQFNQRIVDPYDVEFGTLDYLMVKQDEDGLRYLYVPDDDLRNRIRFLKECRNALAHRNSCNPDQVNELLSMKA